MNGTLSAKTLGVLNIELVSVEIVQQRECRSIAARFGSLIDLTQAEYAIDVGIEKEIIDSNDGLFVEAWNEYFGGT